MSTYPTERSWSVVVPSTIKLFVILTDTAERSSILTSLRVVVPTTVKSLLMSTLLTSRLLEIITFPSTVKLFDMSTYPTERS